MDQRNTQGRSDLFWLKCLVLKVDLILKTGHVYKTFIDPPGTLSISRRRAQTLHLRVKLKVNLTAKSSSALHRQE